MLDVDPSLGAGLDRFRLEGARERALAQVALIRLGRWSPPVAAHEHEADTLGLLVLEGLLTRHIALGGQETVELLAPGDLLQPWQPDSAAVALVPGEARWNVLSPTRLAVLDRRFELAVAPYPELLAAIVGRGVQRGRSLLARLAIAQVHPMADRLLLLFWHLAERLGRTQHGSVVITGPLSQDLLACLACARRSPVNRAVGELAERGLVTRGRKKSWFLSGHPPAELERIVAPG